MAGGVVDVPLRMIGQGYYDSLERVLHADARLMPTDRRDWRALNVTGGDGDGGAAMLTVWLNRYYPSTLPTAFPDVEPARRAGGRPPPLAGPPPAPRRPVLARDAEDPGARRGAPGAAAYCGRRGPGMGLSSAPARPARPPPRASSRTSRPEEDPGAASYAAF
ncbi:hypothetical protein JL722_722 [Aureococcus anophagefferens]|nr:hypothetical protein JL722_722 [Aureococcus anophagefferens]